MKKKNTNGQSCGGYEKIYHLVHFIVSFIGEFSLKCDFDQCKVFFMEKMVQICQVSKRKKFKSPDFYNKFQSVGKNIEGSWFFSTLIFGM
jgi:hypothetical protein